MSDGAELPQEDNDVAVLRARAEALERQLADVQAQAGAQLVQGELKAEAIRAGMVDMDGLKLIDPAALLIGQDGEFRDAAEIIAKLRRDKPWLFGATNSSSAATVPAPAPARRKLATDMSLDEWRLARAELLRRRS
jgi:stage V sporulation protein SpoVS